VLGGTVWEKGFELDSVDEQLSKGTNSFWAHKDILKNNKIPLHVRHQIFNQRVVPAALYGCESWTFYDAVFSKVQAWENRMLRQITPRRLKEDEAWPSYWRRIARCNRLSFQRSGFVPTVVQLIGRLFTFGLRLARTPRKRDRVSQLVAAVTSWKDTVWWRCASATTFDPENSCEWKHKTSGRRRNQWDEPFCETFGLDWKQKIQDMAGSSAKAKKTFFCEKVIKWLDKNPKMLKRRKKLRDMLQDFERNTKDENEDKYDDVTWPEPDFKFRMSDTATCPAVHIFGDSSTIISWFNGTAVCKDEFTWEIVCSLIEAMQTGFEKGLFITRSRSSNFADHVKRKFNKRSDWLATKSVCEGSCVKRNCAWLEEEPPKYVQIAFDGGCRQGVSGAGWCLRAARTSCQGKPQFKTFVMVSVRLSDAGGDSTSAELFGLCQAVRGLLWWCQGGQIVFDEDCRVSGCNHKIDRLDI